ncbi:hypothetical protein N7476_011184 [Penicillium atrosanguineum]|uniref:Uncharacterized protein n=1 Tax=Penicillium atrosanguineum TaxID=1132637 RepID=A0A9W9TZ90_9EURO|nr:hypothetical protein N7476_011184 [Penicillium atrosanguineum]
MDPNQVDKELYTTKLKALVELVEEEKWPDFGFLLFRTYFDDEALWDNFQEQQNLIMDEAIEAAPTESGLSRISDKMFFKQVSDEAMKNTPPEGVALAYRICAEPDEIEGPENDLEPGLHTSMCLLVDEECMRSVIDWKREGAPLPFVKAIDVTLGEEMLSYSGAFKVAIASLFTRFYWAQFECDETADLVPDGDTVWDGTFDAQKDWEKIDRLLNR